MMILALETTTSRLSVATHVEQNGVSRFLSRELLSPTASGQILPEISALLKDANLSLAQIDGIAVDVGPGSFTGVRIGCSVAQGLALGLSLPIAPISSLLAIAEAAFQKHGKTRVIAAIDARMNEIYLGAFIRDSSDNATPAWRDVLPISVLPPLEAQKHISALDAHSWFGAGDAFDLFPAWRDVLPPTKRDAAIFPEARVIAKLALPLFLAGNTCPPEALVPLYARDRVALTLKEREGGAR